MPSILSIVFLCCVLQEPSAVPEDQKSLATALQDARAAYWVGQFAESEALFISALRKVPHVDEIARAAVLSELGDVYVNEDKLEEALHVYRESLQLFKKAGDAMKVAHSLRNVGTVYSLQRRDDDALRFLREALKTARAASQTESILTSQILNSLGVMYYRQGNMSKAEKMFTEAAQLLPTANGLFTRSDLLNNLGVLYHRKRQFQKAEEYLLQSLKLIEAQVGRAHPDVTFSLSALGVMYLDAGRDEEAQAQYERALAILGRDKPIFETRRARLLHSLGQTHAKAGRKTEAEAAMSEAAAIARRNVAIHPDMALIMDAYAAALKKDGRVKEAEQLSVEARRARAAAGLVINAHRPF